MSTLISISSSSYRHSVRSSEIVSVILVLSGYTEWDVIFHFREFPLQVYGLNLSKVCLASPFFDVVFVSRMSLFISWMLSDMLWNSSFNSSYWKQNFRCYVLFIYLQSRTDPENVDVSMSCIGQTQLPVHTLFSRMYIPWYWCRLDG